MFKSKNYLLNIFPMVHISINNKSEGYVEMCRDVGAGIDSATEIAMGEV